MSKGIIQHEEDNALLLNDASGDINVKAIDISLWQCAVQAALHNPELAAAHFRLPQETIAVLSKATPLQINKLASSTTCSFVVRNDEREMIHKLNKFSKQDIHHSTKPIWSFQLQYWLTVQHCLLRDRLSAKVAFGLSDNFLDRLESATSVALSYFIMDNDTIFNLRFSGRTLSTILCQEPTEADHLKRVLQSLNVNSRDLGGLYS